MAKTASEPLWIHNDQWIYPRDGIISVYPSAGKTSLPAKIQFLFFCFPRLLLIWLCDNVVKPHCILFLDALEFSGALQAWERVINRGYRIRQIHFGQSPASDITLMDLHLSFLGFRAIPAPHVIQIELYWNMGSQIKSWKFMLKENIALTSSFFWCPLV